MKRIELQITPLNGPVRVKKYVHGSCTQYTDYHAEFKTVVVDDDIKIVIEAAPENSLPHGFSKTMPPTRWIG